MVYFVKQIPKRIRSIQRMGLNVKSGCDRFLSELAGVW
jgi:hypothetical protein